jgi:hypothetical protein
MAIGTKSNMQINNPFIYSGYTEMLTQFSDAFNAQSRGAISLTAESKRGEYAEETFFQNISGLIAERDPASVAAATDKSLPQSKWAEIKLNRKVGPVATTYDAFRKTGQGGTSLAGLSEQAGASGIDLFDFVIGQQTAKGVQVEMINTLLYSLVAASGNKTGLLHADAAGTIVTEDLVDGLSKMGDAANNINLWLMHSSHFFGLVKQQITSNLDGVTGFVVADGSPVTLNRPVLVIDSPALVKADGGGAGINTYYTFGLSPGVASAIDSEDMMLASQLITGKANLAVRLQGEYSYNLGMHGFSYDVPNGGVNPNAAALATATNWDSAFADDKDYGFIRIETR